ncbi:MAG TPA: hypothetical protein VE172_12360 [Stackebrandtia sp.]|uniref:hypothetical protein n=1 Tax=Stackebrandtia sp. TaxID=2023065 RepID=UPI002D34E0CB|nr:hypothetical protein [Stackebrandtia sp.]HZE39594.1 hypothetical protein [Stackebrandtia sp.]
MNVKIDPQELDGIGDKYGDIITEVKALSGLSMINAYWGYCSDSEDNLHDTSRTLVRHINANCALDLKHEVDDYNLAQSNTDKGNKDHHEPPPDPDLSDPNHVIDEPKYDKADRPQGGR